MLAGLVTLLHFFGSPLIARADSTSISPFSIQLNLKIHGAIDLRTWNRPFTLSKALLADTTSTLLKTENQQFRTFTEIDSSFQTVKIRRTLLGKDFDQPVVFSMAEYIQFRLKQDVVKQLREEGIKNLQRQEAATGGEALTIEVPFKIKSKTFNKIFGGDRVRLRISGNVNITGGFRREGRSQVATVAGQQTDYSFHIDQTQRFKITGEVGDKVSVEVDQDSERMFEFENAIKLTYTGYEDEIIQKIEAGNISLQLAGTQLATFSGQNQGLFGLKTDMKIGPLKLTAIASLEKGKKNKLTVSGGAQQSAQMIDVTQPSVGRYFFVDTIFREQYKTFNQDMSHTYNAARTIDGNSFFLYKQHPITPGSNIPAGLIFAWAVYDSIDTNPTFYTYANVANLLADSLLSNRNYQPGNYLLVDPSQYYLDSQSGYVRLNSPLNSNDVLAVAYKTAGSAQNQIYGDLTPPDSNAVLKLLRPSNPLPTDDTRPLAWRNVYSLGGVNVENEGFNMRIVYQPSGIAEIETIPFGGTQTTFLTLFGLDTRNATGQAQPDGVADDNPAFLKLSYGEIVFPDLQPFDPEGYFIDSLGITSPGPYFADPDTFPDSLKISSIYDSTLVYPSNFKIKADYKSVQATYDLGINVLEGSEEVYLGGGKLQKGSDYVIDYYSGSLTILNEAALSPSANLQILYESAEVFQLDKKTLLGVRAEYGLWDQSFIGATALYLNEKPLQDRVKIGNEPLRNFLWDVNTRLVFKPQFITTAIDRLPLIETEAPSQFTTEVEFAQVHPNPNSLNNTATGDPDGVAYVDDFESIKKTTPLGIMRRNWTQASYPIGVVAPGSLKRGAFVWFNPFDQILIEDIWPNRPTNSNVAQRTHVLSMYFIPSAPDTAIQSKASEYEYSWGGVMRSLSAGYANQSKSKYLEIMLKVNQQGPGGGYDPRGLLHIDLGQISEDVIPNNQLNTEDKNLTGLLYGNGVLDPGEDVGLDGVDGDDPSDHWSIPNGPVSNDDWAYSPNNPNDVWKINGTEGNENDEGGRYPDTEDLDKDGTLDQVNNLFRYTIDLSETQIDPNAYPTNPPGQWNPATNFLITAPNDKHWKLYRIPIEAAQIVGSPNLTQIEYARVWVEGFEDSATYEISIATLDIVGNEWEAIPVITPTDSSYERLAVEMINTYDNDQYSPPPGVAGYRDPVTDIVSQEQSLLLRINDLPRDSVGLAVRRLYDMLDFLEYKRLKMFVHGGGVTDQSEQKFNQRDIWMFFRFGADTSRNYYEYRQRVWPGWAEANHANDIEIDLAELTKLKIDRTDPNTFYPDTLSNGDILGVMGNPSLSQIRQFTVGVWARDGDVDRELDGLEIWLDELRVSEVKKDVGQAVRASADLTLADLGTVHANVDASDGDFHNVNTRTGSRSNSISGSATASVQVQKIFDPKWGLAIPVTGNYSQSQQVPYYFPSSDILVDQGDALQVDSVKTQSRNFGAGIDVSKTSPSSSPWLKYSLDKLSGGYDFARQESSNPTMSFAHNTTHSANLAYNLTFGRPAVGFLFWLKKAPLLKKYSKTKIYPLITKLTLNLSGTEAINQSRLRAGTQQYSHTFFLTKGLVSGLRPFENLTIDFNRTHKADLLMNPDQPKGVEDLLRGDLAWDEDIEVNQSVTASYTPRLVTWLDTDARYNTAYHWQWGNGYISTGQSISNNTSMSLGSTLKLTQIFKKPGATTPEGQRSRPGPGQPQLPGGGEPEKGSPEPGNPQIPPLPGQEPDQGFIPGLQPVPGDTSRGDSTQLGAGRDSTQLDTTARDLLQIAKPKRRSALGDFWYGVRYTITRLRDIRVDYSQQNNWSDPLVDGQAGLGYQLGLNSSAYSRIASAQSYSGYPSRTRSDDYKLKSGLDFAKNFKVNLNYNYRWSKSQSNTVNGTVSESQLYFFKTSGDSIGVFEIPLPDYSIQWTGWEKFPAFQKIAETVTLEHNYTGTRTTTWNDNRSNITKFDYTRNFSPILGVTMTFKRGITSSLRYNWTETGTVVRIPTPSKSRSRQTNLQMSASYSMKTGFRVPIPVWPFKNKRFKNNTTFSLTFNMSSSYTEIESAGTFSETGFTKTWSVKPALDYTFSNSVTGGLHFEYGSNKSKSGGDSNYQEFGLNINITIRG